MAPTVADLVRCHAFSGSPRAVAEQLFALPRSVVEGRFFALLLESDSGASIRVFERAAVGDEHGTVRDWHGSHLGDLPARVVAALTTESAPARSVHDMICGMGRFTAAAEAPCPPSARGAFGHELRQHDGGAGVRACVITC